MQVKLKVIGGKNDGREIRIPGPEFIIGRGDEAHLRPSSDLISRNHCCIKIQNGTVTVSDMGSRNGTFVNGQMLESEYQARGGENLRVGRLQFEIVIDHADPGTKKPRVDGVAEAAARTAKAAVNEQFDEDSITDWLTISAEESRQKLQDTTQFSLDNTKTKLFTRSNELDNAPKVSGPDEISESDSKVKKDKYKKLPYIREQKAESSKGAADDVLRKFFNRR